MIDTNVLEEILEQVGGAHMSKTGELMRLVGDRMRLHQSQNGFGDAAKALRWFHRRCCDSARLRDELANIVESEIPTWLRENAALLDAGESEELDIALAQLLGGPVPEPMKAPLISYLRDKL